MSHRFVPALSGNNTFTIDTSREVYAAFAVAWESSHAAAVHPRGTGDVFFVPRLPNCHGAGRSWTSSTSGPKADEQPHHQVVIEALRLAAELKGDAKASTTSEGMASFPGAARPV